MRKELLNADIAVFTSLEKIALEIVHGAGVQYDTVVDFFELIDREFADSAFTDKVRERFAEL